MEPARPSIFMRYFQHILLVGGILLLAGSADGDPLKKRVECAPSWMTEFDCVHIEMESLEKSSLHWKWTDRGINFAAIDGRLHGWLGISFCSDSVPRNCNSSDAVIFQWAAGAALKYKTYSLVRAQTEGAILQDSKNFIVNASSETLGGITSIRFQRFFGDGDVPISPTKAIHLQWAKADDEMPNQNLFNREWDKVTIPVSLENSTATSSYVEAFTTIFRRITEIGTAARVDHFPKRGLVKGPNQFESSHRHARTDTDSNLQASSHPHLAVPAPSPQPSLPPYYLSSPLDESIWVGRNLHRTIHAILMWSAFTVFLPLGALVARHCQDSNACVSTWFHYHWVTQLVGSAVTFIGAVIAFVKFRALLTVHGLLGVAVLALLAVQLGLGALRPPVGGKSRATWSVTHKTVGMLVLVSGLVNVQFGLWLYTHKAGIYLGWLYWAVLGQIGILIIIYILLEGNRCRNAEIDEPPELPVTASKPGIASSGGFRSRSQKFTPGNRLRPLPITREIPVLVTVSRSLRGQQYLRTLSPSPTGFTKVDLK